LALLLGGLALAARAAEPFTVEDAALFMDQNCATCHNDVDKEAGLDLTSLKFNPADPTNFAEWVKVHDLTKSGQMPPKEKRRPRPAAVKAFLDPLADSLTAFEKDKMTRDGRATQRRLN